MSDGLAFVRAVVFVRGRVQGVGFRYAVARTAQRFEVYGTVRNLRAPDIVEIDVEGRAIQVNDFLEAVVAEPPPGAHIADVQRTDAAPRGVSSFGIETSSDSAN